MRVLESKNKAFLGELEEILAERRQEMEGVEEAVREIIEEVRRNGDEALLRYTQEFDGVEICPEEMEVPQGAWETAWQEVEGESLSSLQRAAERIESFHKMVVLRKKSLNWVWRLIGFISIAAWRLLKNRLSLDRY